MDYIIDEKRHLNSYREGRGKWIVVKNLTEAKKRATQRQVFQDTVLTISNIYGKLLAYKKEDKWYTILHLSWEKED